MNNFPKGEMGSRGLLAIDLGIRAGFAWFAADGALGWFRSRNAGSVPRFRAMVRHEIHTCAALSHIYIEGGGPLATAAEKAASREVLIVQRIAAEQWRAELLPRVNLHEGRNAKTSAVRLARAVIDASALPQPKTLRHDAAEAILIGVWAVRSLGWENAFRG